MYEFENRLWQEGITKVMGLDEVGRGCLAGPVVASGVILDPNNRIEDLNDSKQLSSEERKYLAGQIKSHALFWTIKHCDPEEIDQKNIYWASMAAMEKCINYSELSPEYYLVDGKQAPGVTLPGTCVVKGDCRSASIAAASILAKVHRDELMHHLHEKLPYYGWDTNVGYPTKKHYQGLEDYGITPHHRRSFNLRTSRELQL